jgi:segregation and condensation protein A
MLCIVAMGLQCCAMNLPQEQFRISIDAFDGPLDLLLYLVRRAEVDVHDIPIAQITDEYLEILRDAATVDVEMAGEFLVMAATLIEIKSRSLVPQDFVIEEDQQQEGDDLPTDPKGDLIRQLLAFQRFRTASEHLESMRLTFMNRFDASVGILKLPEIEEEPSLDLDDVHLLDLSDAYEYIASSIDFSSLGEHHIIFDDIPIEMCQEDLLNQLNSSAGKQLTLQKAFQGLSLTERVGLFLAALELVRMRRITVQQDDHLGSIMIELLDDGPNDGEQNFEEH